MKRASSLFFLISIFCPVLSACKPQVTTAPAVTLPALRPGEKMAVIFDDDGSPDGTSALFYLLSHPQVEVIAAAITYGEAYPDIYIQHIGRKLDEFGITHIPLGYGQNAPLAGSNEFPEGLRDASNNFWDLPITNLEKTYPAQPAPQLYVDLINQADEPVNIFISGPCTNLAQALRLDPGIRENIAGVYIMGGAVYVRGNLSGLLPNPENTVAEWNIYADPQAAKEVFESGLDIYLVPLDATNQVGVSKEDTRQLRSGGAMANFAADIYEMWISSWGVEQAAIWDLMTAAIMVQPDLCEFQQLPLQVVTEDGIHSGQTLVAEGAATITVCLEPDAELIRQTLIEVFSAQTS